MRFFKRDPRKKLQQAHDQKMEAAMHAMRRGDIRKNAELVAEAEQIQIELDKLG